VKSGTKNLLIGAALLVGGYYVYTTYIAKKQDSSALNVGAALGGIGGVAGVAGEALQGFINPASGIAGILSNLIPNNVSTGNSSPGLVGFLNNTQQQLSSGASQAYLFGSQIPYVAQTFPSGIISISPPIGSASIPASGVGPSNIASSGSFANISRAIETASVATGFGNFQTAGGAVQYIPPTASIASTPAISQALQAAGSMVKAASTNTYSSNAQASLLATGRIG
jgi:hypothetical protein